jgi:ATP-dependent RNA helicase DDX21
VPPHVTFLIFVPALFCWFSVGDTDCCRVLDECDEMLNMGFVDDVETILGAASKNADGSVSAAAGPGRNASGETLQTLLFSATMPVWVKDITRRFLVQDHQLVDLVGDDKLKVRRSLFGGGVLG